MAHVPASLRHGHEYAAASSGHSSRPGRVHVNALVQRPLVFGLVFTIGALLALVLGVVVVNLATVLTYIVMALFLALGVDPLARRMQSRGIPRPVAIILIVLGVLVLAVLAGIYIVPPLVHELVHFIGALPSNLVDVEQQQWYRELDDALGETFDLNAVAEWVRHAAADPNVWAATAGGLLHFGTGIIGGVVGTVTVLILTIFFLASLDAMKQALYSLIPRPSRAGFADLTEQIVVSIGGYVNGMVILALINAVLGFIAMLIFGVPFAALLAIIVFFVALIPLIGSVLATIIVVIVALFNSPVTAIEIGVYYLVYMQVEAYILTPRIMNKTVQVPGALVVIGALAGGALLGIVGALVAIPVTAAILLIIKKVVVPRQDRAVRRV